VDAAIDELDAEVASGASPADFETAVEQAVDAIEAAFGITVEGAG
jgi:hypothetical protein